MPETRNGSFRRPKLRRATDYVVRSNAAGISNADVAINEENLQTFFRLIDSPFCSRRQFCIARERDFTVLNGTDYQGHGV